VVFRWPVLAWLAGLGVIVIAAVTSGYSPWHEATWLRSDSFNYLDIAEHGYHISRCRVGWCGDAAWFPAYPLLIAGLHVVGVPYAVAGIAIAWIAGLATLVLLWRWYLEGRAAVLALAAFAPGLVYLYAVFPLSLLCLCGIVFVHELGKRRHVAAGIAAAAAAATYPLGIIAVVVIAGGRAIRDRRALAVIGPALVADAVFVLVQRLQTGRWTAYFDMTSNYHGGFHDPLRLPWNSLRAITHASNPLAFSLAPEWQVLVATVLLALAIVFTVRRETREGAAFLGWCVVAWLVPLTQMNQAFWRSEAALALLAPLAVRWPRGLTWAASAALAVTGYALARVFFTNELSG
jgi:hypothetical protein